MDQRLNLAGEVHELKLGSTFNTPKPRTSFHTLKYDFKPASVDISKAATLDVSSNNQVTVTMPHLDSSGVPKTVFKGNQRNYTKECVLIIDKVTGEITLEKLHHNIQVKKTRSENNSKTTPSAGTSVQSMSSGAMAGSSSSSAAMASGGPGGGPARPSLENSTQRVSSKTRVSTGIRKAGLGGIVQRHSPIQGSPSYPHHKSPQQAPAWNANNGQSTLPSIPMISMGMDDDFLPSSSNQPTTQASTSTQETMHSHSSYHSIPPSSMAPASLSVGAIDQHVSQSSHSNHNNNNSGVGGSGGGGGSSNQNHLNNNSGGMRIQSHQNHLHADVGVLTSSDSSDSSDSDNDSASDSGSDSGDDDDDDDNADNGRNKSAFQSTSNHLQNNSSHLNQHNSHSNSNSNLNNRTGSLPALLLDEDLRLSESNSSDSDD